MQASSNVHIIFPSEIEFKSCIKPYESQQLKSFLKDMHHIELSYDPNLELQKNLSINNPQKYNLFFAQLFSDENFNVFYPEFPRIDHHLVIQIKNSTTDFIGLDEDKQLKLHQLINKINAIYVNKLNITGFVTAQYSQPQSRHEGHEVVELLPHHPAYGHCRNFLDKADSNRYVLFDHENISALDYKVPAEIRNQHIEFWKNELQIDQAPLSEKKLNRDFPITMVDSHFDEHTKYLIHSLIQIFENAGAKVENFSKYRFSLPTDTSHVTYMTRELAKCAFCNPNIIQKQQAFEYNGMVILYNFRKMPYPGTSFLILPKRHLENHYSLTDEEVKTGALLKQALANALKAKYPEFEVCFYNQQGAAVGQSVFHTHEQVVSLDKASAGLHWLMLSLSYNPNNLGGVSAEEMQLITTEFKERISEEIAKLEHKEEDYADAV